MKRLIADAQLFQTAAWHRGMGKYSFEVLKALQKEMSDGEWASLELLLSSAIDADPKMVAMIEEELAGVKVSWLDLKQDDIGNDAIPAHNRQVIDRHISTYNHDKDELNYVILSSMQGVIYPVFPTLPKVNKMVVFYDLIPLMFHDVYLRNGITRHEYLPRVGELLRADTYLSISKTVGNDLALYMGIDKGRIHNIDGGAIPHSTEKKRFPLSKPFILMPTGNDLRKNNRRAILGFKEFNEECGNKYSLVITSFFKDYEITELSQLCDDVVFTGNISGPELNYLYEESEALLFPSEYEGLGMPILEAAEHNKPIACSNIAVFREMSTTAFEYFDPYSPLEIAEALRRVTAGHKVNTKEYARLLKKYTWEHTAQAVLAATRGAAVSTEKEDVIICAPEPSVSEVGAQVILSNAEISRYFNAEYAFSEHFLVGEKRVNYLSYCYPVHSLLPGSTPLGRNRLSVYHVGNGREYARILLAALANPGIVILHANDLKDTWEAMVELGLVDEARWQLEQTLQAKLGSDQSGLASLIANQRAIVLFDGVAIKDLTRMAKACSSDILIQAVKLPTPSIVFEDAQPSKTISARRLTEIPFEATDYQWNVEVGKTERLFFDNVKLATPQLPLIAMGLGTVPAINRESTEEYLEWKGLTDLVSQYSSEELAQKRSEALKMVQKDHTYAVFASAVRDMAKKVRIDEE